MAKVTLKLTRVKQQEEPERGLIFWFDGVDSKGNGIMASVWNEPRNMHVRVSGDAVGAFIIGFPGGYNSDLKRVRDAEYETIFRRAIERHYLRRLQYEKEMRGLSPDDVKKKQDKKARSKSKKK